MRLSLSLGGVADQVKRAQLGGKLPLLFLQPRGSWLVLARDIHIENDNPLPFNPSRLSSPPGPLQDFLDKHALTAVLARSLAAAGSDLGVSVREERLQDPGVCVWRQSRSVLFEPLNVRLSFPASLSRAL